MSSSSSRFDGARRRPSAGSRSRSFAVSNASLCSWVGLNFTLVFARSLRGPKASDSFGLFPKNQLKKARALTNCTLSSGKRRSRIFCFFSSEIPLTPLPQHSPSTLSSSAHISALLGLNFKLYAEHIARANGRSTSNISSIEVE